jgi:hypothetical protein
VTFAVADAAAGRIERKPGCYTRIEAPGRCDTAAFGINERGQIGIAAAGTTDGSTCPPQGR